MYKFQVVGWSGVPRISLVLGKHFGPNFFFVGVKVGTVYINCPHDRVVLWDLPRHGSSIMYHDSCAVCHYLGCRQIAGRGRIC